ncbi:MAG: aminopeptidase P family protein [Myxococcales bacterium]|nr:aminopeptidase P family protein [Myxococcales bacterium]
MPLAPTTASPALVRRREALHARLATPALFAAGEAPSRNYPANRYRFRAASHFSYFVGRALPASLLLFIDGRTELFTHPPDPDDALWHGPRPELECVAEELQLDRVRPLVELDAALAPYRGSVATLPTQDAATQELVSRCLGREVRAGTGAALASPLDAALADAMIALRLVHDDAALAQMRFAAAVSAEAHVAGISATKPGKTELSTLAAMLSVLRGAGLEDAYGPIVTTHGEVLHSDRYDHDLRAGDLLLADVGGETPEGWAADITRTWPVSGRYSATQRAIYDVVLAAQHAALAVCKPGGRYRAVHDAAKRAIVEGLVLLGVFRGEVDGLLERGAAALFFPHGIGHLLGLDVHDMEDLGDRAGYAPGRTRSALFGDGYLRLDRDLAPGMCVTIEPGFYQVPGILDDPRRTESLGEDLRRDVLARFSDVRGIRIEDDVLITSDGHEILSAGVPKDPAGIEQLMAAS